MGIVVWFLAGGARGGSPSRYCMEYLRRRAGGGAVLSGFCRRLIVTYAAFAVLEPEAVGVHLEDVNVVGETIEQRASKALGGEHAGPLVKGQVAGDDNRADLSLLKTWFALRQPSVGTNSPRPSGYARPSRFAKEFGPDQVLRSDNAKILRIMRPIARIAFFSIGAAIMLTARGLASLIERAASRGET